MVGEGGTSDFLLKYFLEGSQERGCTGTQGVRSPYQASSTCGRFSCVSAWWPRWAQSRPTKLAADCLGWCRWGIPSTKLHPTCNFLSSGALHSTCLKKKKRFSYFLSFNIKLDEDIMDINMLCHEHKLLCERMCCASIMMTSRAGYFDNFHSTLSWIITLTAMKPLNVRLINKTVCLLCPSRHW